eukprot:TRINITY_DN5637_c0_g1_i1.p1 TRINITY_DN5637_c0_g1~~TRINITY_DN5637_c0_g1_i1.p1  ORF type:complete len:471 (-),score=195.36 TRINITY_DN5637_c0_g1_i1:59-1309(-)
MTGLFRSLYQAEGIKTFWKGNGIACIRLFPYSAIQFSAFNYTKNLLVDKHGKLSGLRAMAAGSLAGVIATVAVYPTDMVKTRLTVQHGSGAARKYSGIVDCFRKVASEEGIFAFYKGMSTSVIGVIPFAGGTFMAYEILSAMWGKPKAELSPWQSFVNGCLAGAFAQTFSFPFDTIRKKLQAQSKVADVTKTDVHFNGMIDCFRQTIQKNGVLGLWRGTFANLAKVAPYAGLMFLAFESTKRYFLYQNGFTTSPWSEVPVEGIDQSLSFEQLKAQKAAPPAKEMHNVVEEVKEVAVVEKIEKIEPELIVEEVVPEEKVIEAEVTEVAPQEVEEKTEEKVETAEVSAPESEAAPVEAEPGKVEDEEKKVEVAEKKEEEKVEIVTQVEEVKVVEPEIIETETPVMVKDTVVEVIEKEE